VHNATRNLRIRGNDIREERVEAIVGKAKYFVQPPAFDSMHDKVAAENSKTNPGGSCSIAERKDHPSSF
jgi:hypothetical protein